MKFLCSHCGSKYQIADDKVNGRVLRMKCRKCSEDIVIDGQGPAGPSVRPAAQGAHVIKDAAKSAGLRMPQRPEGGAVQESVGRRTANIPAVKPPAAPASPLGTGFKKHVSSRPTAGASASQAQGSDQWHVAVNDVPVGPIGKQEILRKMNAGAVHEASLVWREGFDDWRPLREVPELAALLRQAAGARVPPPPIARQSAVPQPPRAPTGKPPQPQPQKPPTHPHRAGDALKPAARSNVVPMPIGGRGGAAPAPAPEPDDLALDTALDTAAPVFAPAPEFEPAPAPSPAHVPSAVPARVSQPMPAPSVAQPMAPAASAIPAAATAPVHAEQPMFPAAAQASASQVPASTISSSGSVARPMPAPPARKPLPPAFWLAAIGMVTFGVAMAYFLTQRAVPPEPVAVAPVAPPAQPAAPVAAEKPVEAEVVLPEEVEVAPSPEAAEPSGSSSSRRSGSKTGTKQPELSEAEKKKLAAMAGGTTEFDQFKDKGLSLSDNSRPKAQAGSLSGDQIRDVVNKNRPALQQCYERSARGVGATSDLRVNVDITIGRSGRVSSVRTSGADLPGLGACLEGSMKRWVFPAAGDETPTRFPLVFAAK